ncbi:hypothetical protein Cgig2_021810 [Carnegiea gigantea]|uniref:Uncharacterized protein n=1 Tax=Carnegiea gigantea TaxID=171969 RepID=A0A9Q1QF97_9CARY|nr:hypothetical protein Cgig2_021810 [Carnegiea gigantea]
MRTNQVVREWLWTRTKDLVEHGFIFDLFLFCISELLAARCGTPQPQGVPKETSSTANTLDNSIDPKQQENEEDCARQILEIHNVVHAFQALEEVTVDNCWPGNIVSFWNEGYQIDPTFQEFLKQQNEEGENDRVKDEMQYSGGKQADGEEQESEEDIDVGSATASSRQLTDTKQRKRVRNEFMLNNICISKQQTKFCGHDH